MTGDYEDKVKIWIQNTVSLNYLQSVNQLSDNSDDLKLYEENMSKGVQQILNKKKSDGSFNIWSESRDSRVWVTAYIVKMLYMSARYTAVSNRQISEALNFITGQQSTYGSFPSNDHNYYSIGSFSQKDLPITAFCAIALMENKDFSETYQLNIDRALRYISSEAERLQGEIFSVAISAYALTLNNHESAKFLIAELEYTAISNDQEMFWNQKPDILRNTNSASMNVEIAAYALMAFLQADQMENAFKVKNWLVNQRQATGGFYRTTDTAIALQALAKFSKKFHVGDVNFNLKISDRNSQKKVFSFNSINAMQVQTQELKADWRSLFVDYVGEGAAILKISYRYDKIFEDPEEQFEITADPIRADNILQLRICTRYISEGDWDSVFLTVIEINFPNGYVYDETTFEMMKSVNVRVS